MIIVELDRLMTNAVMVSIGKIIDWSVSGSTLDLFVQWILR